jgi:hypothetical protein
VKTTITIELDIPDGWEFVEYRTPKEGEYYANQYDGSPIFSSGGNLQQRIIIRTVWTWPAWLKAPWIAMDEDGLWSGCESEPFGGRAKWMTKGNAVQLHIGLLDFTPPPCSDWKLSKRKNPNSEKSA